MTSVTVVVPGFGDNISVLQGLVRFLHQQGIAAYAISPQPSDGTLAIDKLAQQLAATIAECFPADAQLNLVGFSMGGLICRCYVQQFGSLGRTARLITIATPHQGTWTAYTYNRPACIQMRPGSRFLAELNRDLADLQRLQFTSIWTPFDLTILPATSSCLPVGEMMPVLSPFHATLLLDPRILQIVAHQLQQPV
ncbi:MAG: lipase [Caldilinea sp. CFX5]|nr:lipase [Caldilinea sp. CFX5]